MNVGGLRVGYLHRTVTDGWCSFQRCRASGYQRTSVAISAPTTCTLTPRLRHRAESVACHRSPPHPDTPPLPQT